LATTIICALEATTADAVPRAAGELAASLDGSVVLAHVRDDPALFNSSAARERARHRRHRQARSILTRARALMPASVAVEERLEVGDTTERLVALAEETAADFIVLGSRRRGAFLSALLGSVSQSLARTGPCPVMIVPGRAPRVWAEQLGNPWAGRSTVIAGVDGSDDAVRAAVLADELAQAFGDRLLLVHAQEAAVAPPMATIPSDDGDISVPAVMVDALEQTGSHTEFVVKQGPAAYMLQGAAARARARLIVIAAGSDDSLGAQLSAAVWTRLPRIAPCPVVVLPAARVDLMGVSTHSGHQRVGPA
jgi:nucleotide-binding universal stress UspA family protein